LGEAPGQLQTETRAVALYVDAPGVSMPLPALIADAGDRAADATLDARRPAALQSCGSRTDAAMKSDAHSDRRVSGFCAD
jgi:hypothetical protein